MIINVFIGNTLPSIVSWNVFLSFKPLHDCITTLGGEVWVNNTRLNPPFCIEVPVPNPESEWSCIWMLGGIDCAAFYDFGRF